MCRHLAYLGPPITLSSLILDPTHSLYEQSWSPHDMRAGGTVNADAFGLAWYTENQLTRYRRNVPIWTDDNLPGLLGAIRSGAVVAAVRNGTERMPHSEAAVAPFTSGDWAFSHNGRVPGYPDSAVKLAEELPARDLLQLDAPVDSALLFALITHRLSAGPAEAVASVVRDVEAAAPDSRLNLLLTDGQQVIATVWTHSLHVRRTTDSVTVASEPFGDGDWTAVPDRSLLVATATTVQVTPMEGHP
ncbi:glutamine amidotransferase [Kribbella aluminosa]|uniref:Gamma-glutamyl-hercynylcysteine sulfoxide hydrolase n=1 Tax=Kribbella aluminosa TaxID=416017 RepID=A0ABS4UGD4_9ACTN|nr:ergothioneine biosynthesis protein EgtC [Kribbella aluminosa]MBP2350699.1 glutamine amidotransferase [Kribbella aluminosa]